VFEVYDIKTDEVIATCNSEAEADTIAAMFDPDCRSLGIRDTSLARSGP
jgi:hypothetical protein